MTTDPEESEGGFTDEDARLRLLFKAFNHVQTEAVRATAGAVTADDVDLAVRRIRKQCERIDALKYPEGQR